MAREELEKASEAIRQAAEATTEEGLRDRLTTQAEQVATLGARERGPDHGRLARHQHALREIQAEVDRSAGEHIEQALERINAFRETLEGV